MDISKTRFIEKKRILVLACNFPCAERPLNGIFVKQQVEKLSSIYSIAVLSPGIFGWRTLLRSLGARHSDFQVTPFYKLYHRRGFTPLATLPTYATRHILSVAFRGLDTLLREWGKPDLIAAHFAVHSGWLAAQLASHLSIPYILHEHASQFQMYLGSPLIRKLAKEAVQKATRVIAVSPHLQQEVRKFDDSAKTCVIGNLVDTELFIPGPQPSEAIVIQFLSVGILSEQKGIAYLINAAKLLSQQGECDFHLKIIGNGPNLRQLKILATDLQNNGKCTFLGAQPPEEVKRHMQESDVIIMPSLHESFCIVLAEGMACGKPVISTRCGGPEYVVTPETGILVNPADSEALARVMARFIHRSVHFDPDVIRRSVVSRFGSETFLKSISAVYDEAIANVCPAHSTKN